MLMARMKENKINFELVGEKEKRQEREGDRERRERKTMTERVQYVLQKKMGSHSFIHQSAMNEA